MKSLKREDGFTFVETLAAMLFIAIVIPVAVRGVILANRAGMVAERKRVAIQLADTRLNEIVIDEEWIDGTQSGDFGDDWPEYTWVLEDDAWEEDTMRLLTVTVTYVVQGIEYEVRVSTLVEEPSDEETM